MDQLAAMRAFIRVVEAGTFSQAAESLRMPKPTVTKLIQSLETHVSTKLLNRTTRRVTVTPDGAAYYERVVRLLGELDELDGSMALSQAHAKGRLRVDVGTSLAVLVIIPALPDFYARYPEIQIDLGVTDRPVDLIGENVDCVIRGGNLSDQSLIARRIAEMTFVTCAAPSYLARHGEPRHPSELKSGHHIVNYFHPRSGRISPLDFAANGETFETTGPHLIAVNDSLAYVTAATAGLGIVQAPMFMLHKYIEAGKLVRILQEWSSEPANIYVVYPPNRHLSNKLRVFVDWIADLFARNELIQMRV
ncbi:LysR family transcriptional regulator [Bradyrhizobium sp. 2TAF24]|uniref:LysR family transcriptional regulator n=1 Tax=Bradyrhizobium sp. 2TAF24 TaxID=3233011 RepID=UPI003F8D9562